MTDLLIFELGTIPDTAGLRRVYDLDEALSESDVAEYAFQRQRAVLGHDRLPPHLTRIAEISVLRISEDEAELVSLAERAENEVALIKRFLGLVDRRRPTLVFWDGLGVTVPTLHYRALLSGVSFPRPTDCIDVLNQAGIAPFPALKTLDLAASLAHGNLSALAPLDQLARLLGLQIKGCLDGAGLWAKWVAGDSGAMQTVCERRVAAVALLCLRYLQGGDTVSEAAESVARALISDVLR